MEEDGDTKPKESQPSKPSAESEGHASPSLDKNGEIEKERRWTNDPGIFAATVAGVIAVVAYTTVAAWQACIGNRQLAVLQGQLDAMHEADRPRVIFQSAAFYAKPAPMGDHTWGIHLPIKNTGTRSTSDLTYKVVCSVGHVDPSTDQFGTDGFRSRPMTRFSLGPGDSIQPIGCEFTTDELSAAMKTGGIAVVGWLAYRDSLQTTKGRSAEYCATISNISIDVGAPNISGGSVPCLNRNCTDDECDRENQTYPIPPPKLPLSANP